MQLASFSPNSTLLCVSFLLTITRSNEPHIFIYFFDFLKIHFLCIVLYYAYTIYYVAVVVLHGLYCEKFANTLILIFCKLITTLVLYIDFSHSATRSLQYLELSSWKKINCVLASIHFICKVSRKKQTAERVKTIT